MGFPVYIRLQNSTKRLRIRTRDNKETFNDLRLRLRKEFSETFFIASEEMGMFGVILDENGAAFSASAFVEEELVEAKQYEFARSPPEKKSMPSQSLASHAKISKSKTIAKEPDHDPGQIRAVNKETEVVVFNDVMFSASSTPRHTYASRKRSRLTAQKEIERVQQEVVIAKESSHTKRSRSTTVDLEETKLPPAVPLNRKGPFSAGQQFLAEFKDGLIYSGKVDDLHCCLLYDLLTVYRY